MQVAFADHSRSGKCDAINGASSEELSPCASLLRDSMQEAPNEIGPLATPGVLAHAGVFP